MLPFAARPHRRLRLFGAALLLSALAGGCLADPGSDAIPSQHFGNLLELGGVPRGSLGGRLLFPSEYAQRSVDFRLGGRLFVTTPDGRFVIERIPAGAYRLEVHLPGYEAIERSIEIAGGQRAEAGIFKLRRARGRVVGRLALPDGTSAAGVQMRLDRYPNAIVSDKFGIFQFMGVGAGSYRLIVSDARYSAAERTLDLRSGEQQNLGVIPVTERPNATAKLAPTTIP
ncbi:MAG: hypothetical protein HY423_01145 [Candidatus Lambdaproteobacteria bacterium]|nr:hypothetical protein [Candidatus Lambdaproteobacteria bacterium]